MSTQRRRMHAIAIATLVAALISALLASTASAHVLGGVPGSPSTFASGKQSAAAPAQNSCPAKTSGAKWLEIDDLNNLPDGATYSTTVNGESVVHNDDDQVGRGTVGYRYWMLDRFVTLGAYVDFLNAVDPTNNGLGTSLAFGLVDNGLIEYAGGSWKIKDYAVCGPPQTILAANMAKMAIHFVTYNQIAHYANWMATGNIDAGAYTFATPNAGNAAITAYDATWAGIRLPEEDEYYKAAYWDQANTTYNLFGTTSLDLNGVPIVSDVTPSTGVYTVATGNLYDVVSCQYEFQSGQGGQSAYGMYHGAGGYHDMLWSLRASFLYPAVMLRPDWMLGSQQNMRSSYTQTIDPAIVYVSPSFRLVTETDPCATQDFGDLPDPSYPTRLTSGPRHTITANLYLGNCVDAEPDGQPNVPATGDNALPPSGYPSGYGTFGACATAGQDEDGVTRVSGKGGSGWTNGTVAGGGGGAVLVTVTGGPACVGAFFGFFRDGTLTFAPLLNSSGLPVSQPVSTGTFYFDIPTNTFDPGGALEQPLYARFRVTSPTGPTGDPCAESTAFVATGPAPNGEVEDYRWNFGPNAVTLSGMTASSAATPLALPLGLVTLLGLLVGGIVLARRPV